MPTYPSNVGPGQFLPTTQIIDIQSIYDNENIDEDLKQIMIRMCQAFNDYAFAINLKDTGMYNLAEFVTGQVYFPTPGLSSTTAQAPVFRQVFRIVVNFGALPNTASKSVAHGLTVDGTTTFTAFYATATDTTAFTAVPIPIIFTITGDVIDLVVDATNVTITTDFDATNYDTCYVVLEYLKQ